MAISKINTGSIADNAVTNAKVDSSYTTAITTNPQLSGTESMLVPKGTTAQRPASPIAGMLRYNTTIGVLEQYTPVGWTAIASPPAISSVSPTTYNGEQGTTFTINGQAFESATVVKFITNAGVEYTAAVVSFVNSSTLTATTPQDFTVANEPLDVKVINASGLSYTLENCIDCGGSPSWTTASGSLGTAYNGSSSSFTVTATDPDAGATLSYSVTTGSLPTGLSLNSSTGVISGTPTGYTAASTTVSFSITATDNAGNSAARSFSIAVVVTNYFGSGADGAGSF